MDPVEVYATRLGAVSFLESTLHFLLWNYSTPFHQDAEALAQPEMMDIALDPMPLDLTDLVPAATGTP